jgi:hypothetical protein
MLSVDAGPVADPHYIDDHGVVLDRIDNSVLALADPIPFLSGELLAARWTRIVPQRLDSLNDPLADLLL